MIIFVETSIFCYYCCYYY